MTELLVKVYRCRIKQLVGSDYREVYGLASKAYQKAKGSTKRRPYIRAVFYGRGKIFLQLFWDHLMQKPWKERVVRMKLLPCAIELLQLSTYVPLSRQNPNRSTELLHRFLGITPENVEFVVQVKEDKRTGEKWFMSVFPFEHTRK